MKMAKTHEVRVKMSEVDWGRLHLLCNVLEMSQAEFVRYYIRQAYGALGARVEEVPSHQGVLFPVTFPDGKTALTVPIPAALPNDLTL